jgi:two-component system OmpR family response regulator
MSHILIVEDDAHIAKLLKLNLEAEGFTATIAIDGPSALSVVGDAHENIDLLILDIMLPGMSGYAVCEAIREKFNNLPVVILSARTLTEDRIRGFDAGADVYLQKPFDLAELLSVVRSLLSRRDGRRNGLEKSNGKSLDVYKFGNAKINFDTFEVSVAENPVRLSSLEIKLLRYFVEHEGSVVSRNELLEEVWGMNHSPNTRTVDNFIVNLRKAFETDPTNPQHFLSVRGAGYRFVAEPAG